MSPATLQATIPGPTAPAVLQTRGWISHPPLQRLEELHRRHGDVFRLEILGPRYRRDRSPWPLVRRTVVVFTAPEHVREIFAKSGEDLRAGEAHEFLEWFLGPRSLMLLDGDDHLDERRRLLSLFAHERLPRYEAAMREAVRCSLSRWPTDRFVALGPLLDRTLQDANLAVVFGPGDGELGELREALDRARPAFSAPILFLPPLRADLGPWSPGGRVRALQRALRDAALRGMNGKDHGNGAAPTSLLGSLGAMDREAPDDPSTGLLFSRLITVLGGLDSSSAALAWCCHHLLRHPEALERARESAIVAAENGDRAQGSYLDAACKEALRLHPVFPAVVRRVANPVSIGAWKIPAGAYVMPSMHLLHRRPEIYPDPLEFRPERFIERTYGPHEYAPFGSGLRRCLGFALAPLQMRVVLGEMLRRFDLSIESAPSEPGRRNVTVVPGGAMRVLLRPRATTEV